MSKSLSIKEIKAKRNLIEKTIVTTFNILDKTGKNGRDYQEFFNKMNDKEFVDWIEDFLGDPQKNFFLETLPLESEPNLRDIKKAADFLKIPLEEIVYIRNSENKDDATATSHPVFVGYILIKKMQQMLEKKNTYSVNVSKRSAKTGQLIDEDKIARITDIETNGLTSFGAEKILKTFLGPMADDQVAKQEMYRKIADEGYVKLSDLNTGDPRNKETLNLIDMYFLGGGIRTNLVDPSTMELSKHETEDKKK